MKSIFIRCDANDVNGYGHLSRCLNIARGIVENHPDYIVTFVGDYSTKARSLIGNYNFPFVIFPAHDPESSRNLIPFLMKCEYLILDSYKITQKYIDELSKDTFKFCLIADESTLLNCSRVDLVVNYAINGRDFDYKCPSQALGLKFFPVKPELKKLREKNLLKEGRSDHNILLLIGGHDIYAVGSKLLKLIDDSVSNKKITFISSADSAGDIVIKNNDLNILPFVEKIEEVYENTDLSITGGGLSKYESGFCRIRNACIPQNINEYKDSLHFEANKLTKIIGIAYDYNEIKVKSNISELFTENSMAHQDLFYTDSLNNLVNVILN